jgi:hypothetical protein
MWSCHQHFRYHQVVEGGTMSTHRKRSERGVCPRCGGERDSPPRLTCDACAEKVRERNHADKDERTAKYRQRRENLKALGLCYLCGGGPPMPGLSYCSQCSQKRKNSAYKQAFGTGTRDVVLARDDHRCWVCSKETRLVVHHIDGNGHGKTAPNNDLTNLVTLCRWCHSRLEFFLWGADVERFVSLLRREPL